jgi:hypothetical protein
MDESMQAVALPDSSGKQFRMLSNLTIEVCPKSGCILDQLLVVNSFSNGQTNRFVPCRASFFAVYYWVPPP